MERSKHLSHDTDEQKLAALQRLSGISTEDSSNKQNNLKEGNNRMTDPTETARAADAILSLLTGEAPNQEPKSPEGEG